MWGIARRFAATHALPHRPDAGVSIMNIRAATDQDRENIRWVHWSAFPEDERESVSKLAIDLLAEQTTPETISLVAETGGAIVGHVAFSPVITDSAEPFQAYILAPLGVKPDCQRQHIGSQLVEYGMRQLSAMGVNVIFVYGDPEYYGRFGFSAEAAHRYTAPYTLKYPFGWQAIVLNEYDPGIAPLAITCVNALCKPELW